jgi:outer membrane protein insertion porin family
MDRVQSNRYVANEKRNQPQPKCAQGLLMRPYFSLFVLIFAIGCCTISAGCQSPMAWQNQKLPVPDPILDTSSLENVRYQSPGGGQDSGPAGILNSKSHRMGVLDAPVRSIDGDVDRTQLVSTVEFRGNTNIPTHRLRNNISTRPGRYYDPVKLQQDVNQLWSMPEIKSVNGPYIDRTPDGVVVTFEVVERNQAVQVEFIGNRGISDKALKKESGLSDGIHMDVHRIRMAKNKIEEYYREKGYPRTQVEIVEGNENSDNKIVFLIHEDQQQRIWKTSFEGNSIATDARLRTFIKSKPSPIKIIGGLAKRQEIDEDVTRLEAYYKSLGFFNAQIGREISESNDGRWLTVRYIINEGPRYKIRNVNFVGNQSYRSEDLMTLVALKPGEGAPEFNVAKMNKDVVALRDLYGSQGFVFADVQAEPRFLEEPGLLDLVYRIDEGKQYRVGKVNVHYDGDYGITKREVVLNRLSVHPGDLIDAREIKNSERRLGTAQIFATGQQAGGAPPRIVVRPPELKELERHARLPSSGSSSRSSAGSSSRN